MTSSNASRVGMRTNLLIAIAGAVCFVVPAAVTVWAARVQGNSWFWMWWILGIPLFLSWVMVLRRALLISITISSLSMKLRYWGRDCRIDLRELQGVILYRQLRTSPAGMVLDLADGSRVAVPASAAETRRLLKLLRFHLPGLPTQRRWSFSRVRWIDAFS